MTILGPADASIVVPLHNGEYTVARTLQSIFDQHFDFKELIIINDGSSDKSPEIVEGFVRAKSIPVERMRMINHSKAVGLAGTYNEGVAISKGRLLITIHQDVILHDNCLNLLVAPFTQDNTEKLVATAHIVTHPFEVWEQYNFWGKAYFARLAGKEYHGLDGKCDCFRKEDLLKTGGFDDKRFRSAGEDGDILFKLKKIGTVVQTNATITHIHNISPAFGPRSIIYKQQQYSEAQGVLLRIGDITGLNNFIRAFFREILVLALCVPYIRISALILILLYSVWYTKIVFVKEHTDKRILILPLLNIYLLFVSLVYSFKGFIYGKQRQ